MRHRDQQSISAGTHKSLVSQPGEKQKNTHRLKNFASFIILARVRKGLHRCSFAQTVHRLPRGKGNQRLAKERPVTLWVVVKGCRQPTGARLASPAKNQFETMFCCCESLALTSVARAGEMATRDIHW